jgi:hypothetical protein
MMNWGKFFAKAENSGVYAIEEEAFPEINKAAVQAGLAVFRLDLAGVNEKAGFLNEAAKVLQFPSYFGFNWDAFEDCLTDLSWFETKGYVLLIQNLEQFQQNAPADAATTQKILEDAADYWKQHKIPFFVFGGV